MNEKQSGWKTGKELITKDFREYTVVVKPRENLKKMIGKTILIKECWINQSEKYGDYLVIRTVDNAEFYSFSKILLDQEPIIKEEYFNGHIIRAKVAITDNNQVYLTAPDQ